VDVDVFVNVLDTPAYDDALEYVFDYDQINQILEAYVNKAPIELQETLCDDILEKILALPLVVAARVITSKPDIYPHCPRVGIERFEFS
jgi:dihydroneopterin aldolase